MLKKVLLLVVLSFFCLTFTTAFAESQATQNTGVSQEDAKKLKDAAQLLGNAFDVKPKEAPKQEQKKAEVPTPKTLADVADKGLDMVKGFVAELSSTLEKIAPKVWAVMVRQQYAKAISGLVVPWGLLILTLLYQTLIKKWWKKEGIDDSDEETAHLWITRIIPYVVDFIFAIWGCIRLSDSILLLINPEYYAIKDLLEMILR